MADKYGVDGSDRLQDLLTDTAEVEGFLSAEGRANAFERGWEDAAAELNDAKVEIKRLNMELLRKEQEIHWYDQWVKEYE